MDILVGGERREIKENTSVEDLLRMENVEMPDYVSVAVNEDFVLRPNYSTHILRDGDVVEFFYYMGGGEK